MIVAKPTKSTDRTDYQDTARPLAGMAKDFAAGSWIEPHCHPRAQLTWAISGVMTLTAARGTWVVPPNRALWIPAETEHEIRMAGPVAMRAIYVDREVARVVGAECKVILVSPLLRVLMLEIVAAPLDYDENGRMGHVAALFLDEIRGCWMRSRCISRCRAIRGCAEFVKSCCATLGGARHWSNGRLSPAPVAALWRAYSSAKPACALSIGGNRRGLPVRWSGLPRGAMSRPLLGQSATKAPAPSRRCFTEASAKPRGITSAARKRNDDARCQSGGVGASDYRLIRTAGAKLFFLPRYSPDLN
jgi:quercetin dioxygenase-like cupin family protein